MKYYIIITGRNKVNPVWQGSGHLKPSFDLYKRLLQEGFLEEVIYSTGRGCAENVTQDYKEFTFLETDPPLLNCLRPNGQKDQFNSGEGHGNCWVQTQQLEDALQLIKGGDDSFVLKTRPDVLISEKLIKEVFEYISRHHIKCSSTKILNKVWNPWFDLTKPFYMADECFAGRLSDLKKFINYRSVEYPKLFQGITHVRRTIEPFLDTYPTLMDYISSEGDSNHLYALTGGNRKQAVLNGLKTESYRQHLAAYYHVLNKYFFIHNSPGSIKFRAWSSNIPNQIKPQANVEANVNQVPFLINTFILGYNDKFIKNINQGVFEDDISQDIYAKIKKYQQE